MRTHGVANFPDPSAGPGGEGFHGVISSPGSDSLTVDGITFSGPAFRAAQKACTTRHPPPAAGSRSESDPASTPSHRLSSTPRPRAGGSDPPAQTDAP